MCIEQLIVCLFYSTVAWLVNYIYMLLAQLSKYLNFYASSFRSFCMEFSNQNPSDNYELA
jgi:hypothetical protein